MDKIIPGLRVQGFRGSTQSAGSRGVWDWIEPHLQYGKFSV